MKLIKNAKDKEKRVSFVIAKEMRMKSEEDVFIILKSFYADYLQDKEKIIDFCKKDNRFIYDEEKKKIYIEDLELKYEERMKLSDFLVEKFGFDYWANLSYVPEWSNYTTYKEYRYDLNNEKNLFENSFVIIDMEKKNFTEQEENIINDILFWNILCFGNENFNKENCKGCILKSDKECKMNGKQNTDIIKHFINEVGRFIICSKKDFFDDYIVKKLISISNLKEEH